MPETIRNIPFMLRRAWRPRTAVTISESIDEYVCAASSTRIEFLPDVRINVLRIKPELQGVHIKDGTFGSIEFIPPRNATHVSTDLVFENCEWSASEEHHMRVYARRIEFIRCRCTGTWYSCFTSDDVPKPEQANRFKLEDFLFYGCDFRVDGDASACLRLHDVRRVVIDSCNIASAGRHCLRVHGFSYDLLIRNLICEDNVNPGRGIHIGAIGDAIIAADQADIKGLWLQDITTRVTGPVDIDIDRGVRPDQPIPCIGGETVHEVVANSVWSYRRPGQFSTWEAICSEPCRSWNISRSGRRDLEGPA